MATQHPARQIVSTTFKLAAAGASLCAVAWAVVSFYPSKEGVEVKASQADIGDFLRTPIPRDHKFIDALTRLGHETPRVYHYNGNELLFSTRTVNKKPYELLREYQSELVSRRFNERHYLERDIVTLDDMISQTPRARKTTAAMLSDQLVPTEIHEDKLVMQAVTLAGEPSTAEQFIQVAEDYNPERPFHELFQNYRYVEADWDQRTQSSTITATWGAPGFDVRRTLPTQEGGVVSNHQPEPDVPACLGCTRLTHFRTMQGDRPMSQQVFSTDRDTTSVLSFYQQSLPTRGWQETEASALTTQALKHVNMPQQPYRVMQFARGDQFLTVAIDRATGSDKTFVNAFISD